MASQEGVRDLTGRALRAGDGVSIVVDDPGNTITISADGGDNTAAVEQLQTDLAALDARVAALETP